MRGCYAFCGNPKYRYDLDSSLPNIIMYVIGNFINFAHNGDTGSDT